MKESIFRKESLEKINSPGQLNRYIRVAEPGLWIVLAALMVLLLGALGWGIFGTLETSLEAVVSSGADGFVCIVDDDAAVQPGMIVRAGGEEGRIIEAVSAGAAMGMDISLPFESPACFRAEFSALAQGIYDAEVIVERIAPISFVIG